MIQRHRLLLTNIGVQIMYKRSSIDHFSMNLTHFEKSRKSGIS